MAVNSSIPFTACAFLVLLCILQADPVSGRNCYFEPAVGGQRSLTCPKDWVCVTKHIFVSPTATGITQTGGLVVRSCSKEKGEEKKCGEWKLSDNEATATQLCYCDTDLCNTSSAGRFAVHTGSAAAIATMLIVYFTH
ncbi:uncharacterized protein LOC129589622 [Paramacrobiotus metropolitanus]|uniref:uncharacterized protein LOC129589622 n=1 Tax=Paramacrobiotus metropolitanus TaxID=2943436 RepID=UPI0024463C02|nr:uncharacterized protein LOC129589622 [Paramacrobiotus metropolitanus]XP_055340417.1 uncharacterized protein LOC129589622 [Paramacrobiotus metropolitanus]XP_055340418.1 uncharacterized protein LOC129589622 [Paramacrobiotus metropolitanus]